MPVSLTITPLEVRDQEADVQVCCGTSVAICTISLPQLRQYTPMTVKLKEQQPALPSVKQIKRLSMKQETRVATALGGKRHAGSGASVWAKGDGRVRGKYRIENKLTFARSFTVKREDLDKIRSECSLGEQPLFQLDFHARDTRKLEESWVLVPFEHLQKMVEDAAALNR